MAERTAAPAAEIALSPKPKLTSVKLSECEGESPPETATFLSNSTVVLVAVAAPIHEDNPCFVDDDPTINFRFCVLKLMQISRVFLRFFEMENMIYYYFCN